MKTSKQKTNKLSNNNIISTSPNPPLLNSNKKNNNSASIINQPKRNKRKKVLSQKNVNEYNTIKTSTMQTQIKNTNHSKNGLNSKLQPVNYVKPLYYTLYSKIRPINKQFLGYKFERNYLYYPFPPHNTNVHYVYQTNIQKEENKENNNSKNKSLNNRNNNNKEKSNMLRNQNLKNMNNKTTITYKTDINSITDGDINLTNLKISLIQACFRGYLARKIKNNSLSTCSKFKDDINTYEKIIKFKSNFFNKLKQFNEDYKKNKNINNKILYK